MQQKERSRRCALWPNHEFVISGCQHRTVSIVWTAQTSGAQYIAAIYLLGCIAVWNPSKPPRRFSFGDRYLSCFLCPFFVLHTKNHATYFHSDKLDFKTYFFLKIHRITFGVILSYREIFPYPPRNIIKHVVPVEFVLCINNLFKIKIIIYLQL